MARVIGRRRFKRKMTKRVQAAEEAAGRGMFVAAGIIQTEARRKIVQGAIQGKGHIPSAPGEPPNRDTGTLDGSIETRKTGRLTAETVSEAPYSAALEFGTSKMYERPFMRPTAKEQRPKILQLIARLVGRGLRGVR